MGHLLVMDEKLVAFAANELCNIMLLSDALLDLNVV